VISLAVPAAGWVVLAHTEITPASNFHQLRDTTADTVTITVVPTVVPTKRLPATPPTVAIAALSGPAGGVYSAAIALSETSTNFTAADLSLTNATATLTGSGASYTATLTPLSDGEVAIWVDARTFTDAVGDDNTASKKVSATFDGTSPTVTISGAPSNFSGAGSFTVSVTFSEPVSGFGASDVAALNASATAVTGGNSSFTVTIVPTGAGDVTLSVPAGVAADGANNPNLVSNSVVVTNKTAEATQKIILGFLDARANNLLASQPDLLGLMLHRDQGALDLETTRGSGSFNFAHMGPNSSWVRLNGAWSSAGTTDSAYAFGAIGHHYRFGENLLLGAMIQGDYAQSTDGAARTSGYGWLAGPYVVARLANQPLFFEGSLLYGQTYNTITPFGTHSDDFNTDRLLAKGALTGEIKTPNLTFYPKIGLAHTTDEQASYTDSLGNAIAAQGISLTEASAGLKVAAPIEMRTGTATLSAGLTGFWSQSSGTGAASGFVSATEGGRARVDIGLEHRSDNGLITSLSGFYDGLGADSYQAYGLGFSLNLQF